MIRYGTNPIAWSNDDDPNLGKHISLETCLGDAAKIGFDGIEKGHKFPEDSAELKKLLESYGLLYVSGWHSLELLERDGAREKTALQSDIDFLKVLGSGICIVCETSNSVHGNDRIALGERPRLDECQWKKFAADLDELAQWAQERGIALAYHHHMGTIVQSEAEIDRLMEDAPNIGLVLDTGHALFGGGDPVALAKRHMARVRHIHAKNVRPEIMEMAERENLSFLECVRRGVFTVPGDPEGTIEFEPMLAVAAERDYRGWLVIEAEQDPDIRNPYEYQSLGLKCLKEAARKAGLDKSADRQGSDRQGAERESANGQSADRESAERERNSQ